MNQKILAEKYKINFHLDASFSSAVESHRLNIRQHILKNYPLTDEEQKAVLDLDRRPKSENSFFSIAHTNLLGGYVASSQPVGFDIELISRLTPAAVKRISSEAECALFEDVRLLWPIKESLVKLLSASLMSEVVVRKFQNNQFETREATGFVWIDGDYCLAVAFKRGQATFL